MSNKKQREFPVPVAPESEPPAEGGAFGLPLVSPDDVKTLLGDQMLLIVQLSKRNAMLERAIVSLQNRIRELESKE